MAQDHEAYLFSQQLSDERLMDLALRLGRRCAGSTAENPPVGCVIARQESQGTVIVGRGWTQRGGRPHAERVALAEAGEKARGATAYVTLEPCSHYGKTPPCAEALIEAGIARLVCAHPDPDPRVAGRGFAMLRENGIVVEVGLLQQGANRDLAGFLSRILRKRPWIQAKMAVSIDGMIGVSGVGNYPVTGAQAKKRTYGLRMRADAIMVGIETVLIDNPSLNVRSSGLEDNSPIRIILDSRGRIPLESQLVRSAHDIPVWIVTTGSIPADKALALEESGCRILLVDSDKEGRVDLPASMHRLAKEGVNRLFVECGATLSSSLLQKGLIDEFFLYQGSLEIGETGISALGGTPRATLKAAGLYQTGKEDMCKDLLQIYTRAQSLEELGA